MNFLYRKLTEIFVPKKPWFSISTEPSLLAKDLEQFAKIGSGSTVLDIGCGYGKDSEYFASLGAGVDAINIDRKELAYAKAHSAGKVNYVYASAGDIPFPDGKYDAVLDSGCSHQCDLNTQLKIVREVIRVLKPKGYLMYFGFSKNHPGYQTNIAENPNYDDPGYRSIEDVKKQYGKYFDILKVGTNRWKGGKYGHHEGLVIAMRKK